MFARSDATNKAETESEANKVNPAEGAGMPRVNYSYTEIFQSRFFWNLRKRRFSTGNGRDERVSLKLSTARVEQNGVAFPRLKRRQIAQSLSF